MAFGEKQNQAALQISANRLASLAGGVTAAAPAREAPSFAARPVSVEPDISRIRPRGIDETPEQQQRRLAAKTVNFTATILARLVIMGALATFAYDVYEATGTIHRGVAMGLFLMTADLGRVILKAMEPGTK